jgi:hypothetical protein
VTEGELERMPDRVGRHFDRIRTLLDGELADDTVAGEGRADDED